VCVTVCVCVCVCVFEIAKTNSMVGSFLRTAVLTLGINASGRPSLSCGGPSAVAVGLLSLVCHQAHFFAQPYRPKRCRGIHCGMSVPALPCTGTPDCEPLGRANQMIFLKHSARACWGILQNRILGTDFAISHWQVLPVHSHFSYVHSLVAVRKEHGPCLTSCQLDLR